MRHSALILLICLSGISVISGHATEVVVSNVEELRAALRALKSQQTLRIAPGEYPGGFALSNLSDLTIEALDRKQPPVFTGGKSGFQFSRCANLTLRHLYFTGQTLNGLNLDDGSDLTNPVAGITLENLVIRDIGPQGNHDGIKGSGLEQLTIRDCVISGWGGQGIDLVGCHRSVITGCQLIGKEGFSATAGIQLKGGSSDIVIENCQFTHAGERPINLGGSTGLPYFRPPGVKHEAARLIVRNNRIEGSLCAAAFVGVDGAEFTDNIIRYPGRWLFRNLWENRGPGFAPSRNVLIRGNRILFRRAEIREDINQSPGVEAEALRFEGNDWLAEDKPQASKPKLPGLEKAGVYGKAMPAD